MADVTAFDIPADDIAPGIYKGVLEKVEVLPSTDERYPGDFRKWHFLLDVEGTLTPITATSSLNNGPKTKTYRWLKALIRTDIKAGATVPSPVGQSAQIKVTRKPNGYAGVEDVLPLAEPEQVVAGVPR